MQKFRIKVIIPNADMDRKTLDERNAMLSVALSSDASLSVDCIPSGPAEIASCCDVVQAAPYVLAMAKKAQNDCFDAIVIYCFTEPGIEACRECLDVPIVGPCEASLSVAQKYGYKIGVITTLDKNIHRLRRKILDTPASKGISVCSIRALNISVLALRSDEQKTKIALENACKQAVCDDGAEVIILGCLGMAKYGGEISSKLGVPILDPSFIAVAEAEMLCRLRKVC